LAKTALRRKTVAVSAIDFSDSAPADAIPPDLVEVGCYSNAHDASSHGLVVLAAGAPYWLVPAGDHFRILVEPAVGPVVRRQLAAFDRESIGWPPVLPDADGARRPAEFFTPMLWSLVVLAVFWAQTRSAHLTELGALDPQAIFARGEWWRPATSLFLHADLGHLISNALSGILVFSAVTTTLGRRLALAACAANLAVAALHHGVAYRSIGASTAIFAGLGLLTGRAVRIAAHVAHPYRWRVMLTPLAAGIAVLGLYGAGGVHVDVLAHLAGFLAGLLLGALAPPVRRSAETSR
jgi:membrane associated rhomboid family serine protease